MKNSIAIIVFLFLFGCQKPIEKIDLPKPLKIYKSETKSVSSFDYDRLEPYLERANDTLYVYNFWATWCVPCVEELPYFEAMNRKYKNEKFKMVLISLDFPKMVESSLLPFIENKNLQSEVYLLNDPDANRWIPKIDSLWSGAIPATLFVKKNKRLFFEQSFDAVQLEKEIVTLLNN
uniref:TlpA family protein disulfide reductase n=1 Tax=Flavobacterium sp. TaxID=239 RepID=UPI00404B7EFD